MRDSENPGEGDRPEKQRGHFVFVDGVGRR